MTSLPYRSALIVGAGSGISASVARALAAQGVKVGLAARNTEKLTALAAETGAATFQVDASDPAAVAGLFQAADDGIGEPDVVIYNASGRLRGPIAELDPAAVAQALAVTAYGAFLVTQQAAKRMLPQGRGAILLTGATAGIKGFALSAPFAMASSPCAASPRAPRASSGRRASMSRISSSTARSAAPATRTRTTTRSTLTPSPRAISTCSGSHAAPGRSRSSFGPGSRASEGRSELLHRRHLEGLDRRGAAGEQGLPFGLGLHPRQARRELGLDQAVRHEDEAVIVADDEIMW